MAFVENKNMAGYEPPPLIKGTYDSKITNCKECDNGSLMFSAEIQEGEFAGRVVNDFVQIDESRMTEDWMVERARNRQYQIEQALGISFSSGFDTDSVSGKMCRIQFSPRKNRQTGEMEDAIMKYLPE
jgi:hypothetical protein